MALWAWFLTLIKGFLPVDGKRIGKIIWLLTWIILALTVYRKVFEPKTVTKIERQVIEKQIINECPEESQWAGIRLNLWKFKIGLGI